MSTQLIPKPINLLGLRKKVILLHSNDSPNGNTISMRAITKEEEDYLDSLANKGDIYIYGDVTLTDKNDINTITNQSFVSTTGRSIIYTGFDYNNGCFYLQPNDSGKKEVKEYEYVVKDYSCTDSLLWFKFKHCLLGKPKKIIVYNNNTYDTITVRTRRGK